MTRERAILTAAMINHESNRIYCEAIGDFSQPFWAGAPDWQRDSAIHAVEGVLAGNTPEQSHESWLDEKERTGWCYGPEKDVERKTHPCFMPYAELPPEQKVKDALCVGVVRAILTALGVQ